MANHPRRKENPITKHDASVRYFQRRLHCSVAFSSPFLLVGPHTWATITMTFILLLPCALQSTKTGTFMFVIYALHMALSFPRANDRLIRHLIGVILKKIPITLYSCMKHWRDLLRINPFVDRRRRSYSDSKLFTN